MFPWQFRLCRQTYIYLSELSELQTRSTNSSLRESKFARSGDVVSLEMEIQQSVSRAVMRRKYKRVEGNQFVVEKKRVKVAGISSSSSRPTHRLRLRCCNLAFLSPYKLMAQLKETYTSLTMAVPSFRNAHRARGGAASTSGAMNLGYETPNSPSSKVFVSSTKDVVDEAWFQYALNRSIREGTLTLWLQMVFEVWHLDDF